MRGGVIYELPLPLIVWSLTIAKISIAKCCFEQVGYNRQINKLNSETKVNI